MKRCCDITSLKEGVIVGNLAVKCIQVIEVYDLRRSAKTFKSTSFRDGLHESTLSTLEHNAELFAGSCALAFGTATGGFTLTCCDTATNAFFVLARINLEFIVLHYLSSFFAAFLGALSHSSLGTSVLSASMVA